MFAEGFHIDSVKMKPQVNYIIAIALHYSWLNCAPGYWILQILFFWAILLSFASAELLDEDVRESRQVAPSGIRPGSLVQPIRQGLAHFRPGYAVSPSLRRPLRFVCRNKFLSDNCSFVLYYSIQDQQLDQGLEFDQNDPFLDPHWDDLWG